ncbi:MAG: hypothetical protein ABF443_13965 [Acetobacter malorum]|uniref:hypothetical protein n=1 Tax=Acetobacter malorum TaxID=178901 RepID=UPI0039E8225F
MDFNAIANAHDAFNLPQIVILNDTLKAPESSWNTVFTDWVKAIGIGSLITGVLMYRVARGQLKISKLQHVLGRSHVRLTKIQAETAKEQRKIAEDKFRFDLFQKRFETYELFLDMAVQAHKLSSDYRVYESSEEKVRKQHKNLEYLTFIKDNTSKLISLGEGSLFLFGSEVKILLDQARSSILNKHTFIESLNTLRAKKPPITHFVKEISEKDDSEIEMERIIRECDKFLQVFYERKLPEIMEPYLKMTPYLCND